jgi:anti-sigma B factor antagonist
MTRQRPSEGATLSADVAVQPADHADGGPVAEVTIDESPAGERCRRVVLALRGELDVVGATDARKLLLSLGIPSSCRFVLDLSGLTFIDSTGIRLILQTREHALQHGAEFVLVRGPERVMRVLELVGLDEQLDTIVRTPPADAVVSEA